MSLDTAEIPWETHLRWLADTLADPDRTLLIGEWQGVAVGQVRFDVQGKEAEISVTIAPECRSRGLGRRLVEAGLHRFEAHHRVDTVMAAILPANEASKRVFAHCGFVFADLAEVRGVVCERWVRKSAMKERP